MSAPLHRSSWTRVLSCGVLLALAVGSVGPETTTASAAASNLMEIGPATVGRQASRAGSFADTFLSGDIYESHWKVHINDGWSNETSGVVEFFAAQATHLECHAGGESSGTHYARVRRKLPERDNFAIRKRFSIESTFELPGNFYEQHESYMRLITTENSPGSYRSSDTTVGTSSPDEWRVGVAIYRGDGLFRLVSDHKNHSTIVLWTAPTRLATGWHTVKINFAPSRTSAGAWDLYIDDARVGSGANVQTVPISVRESDVVVTRIGGCLDGASDQDQTSIHVNLSSIEVRAEI